MFPVFQEVLAAEVTERSASEAAAAVTLPGRADGVAVVADDVVVVVARKKSRRGRLA